MSNRDRKLPPSAESSVPANVQSQSLFSPEQRASLRRDLGPSEATRERVRATLLSSIAVGTITPAAQRVDALMHGHAASAAGIKASAASVLHALSTKVVVASLVVATGVGAVLLRGAPEAHRQAAHSSSPMPAPAQPAAEAVQPSAASTPAMQPVTQVQQPHSPAVTPLAAPSSNPATTRSRSEASASRARATRHAEPQPVVAIEPLSAAPRPAAAVEPADARAAVDTTALEANSGAAVPPSAAPGSSQTSPANTGAPQLAHKSPALALSAELALMSSASDALQRDDADSALRTIQRYNAQFPQGALQVEAAALRAIALCRAHSADSAAVSAQFIRAHARSALAERVQRACATPAPEESHVP